MNQLTAEILSRIISIIFVIGALYLFYIISRRAAIKRIENAKELHICPKCGSLRLALTDKLPPATRFIGAVPAHSFICADCDYEGIAPMIDKTEIESFRKKLKSNKKK